MYSLYTNEVTDYLKPAGICHSFLRNTNVLAHAHEACASDVRVRIKCLLRCLSELQHGVRSGITNPETKSVPCLRSTFTRRSSLFFIPLVRLETLRRKQISWQRSPDYRFPEWTGLQPTRRKPLRSSKACQLYFAGPLKDKSEEEQVSYLLIWSGEEGIELVSTWSLTTDEKKKLSTYWEKFEDFMVLRSNFRLARYKLRTLKQEAGESFDSFLKKVRILVNECKFTNPDEHIIDTLIFGSNNPRVQSKLLEYDASLTLNKAVSIARTQEATSNQLQDIRGSQITTVDALQHGRNTQHMNTPPAQGTQGERCGNCGTFHDPPRRSCPAYGTKCDACGKFGHWRSVCRFRPRAKTRDKQHRPQVVHAIDTTEPNTNCPTVQHIDVPHTLDTPQLYLHSLYIDSVVKRDTQALLQIEVDSGQSTMPLLCKIDTGAEGNVIPVNTYKQLYPQSAYSPDGAPLGLCPSNTTITAFGGHTIQHCGTCKLNLSHNGHSKPYPFHVVNTTGPTILGLPTCRDMKLVTLNYSLTTATSPGATKSTPKPSCNADAKKELLIQYEDCFKGVGCFPGEFHITLDPTVPPVIHPPRRVPEALREPLKKELDALVQQGIIIKVDEPTD